MHKTAEHARLASYRQREGPGNWKEWGPYLSERAWGTIREDYSAEGNPWGYFTHAQSRSRAYRWNEDGLLGISDRHQFFCFALALWNGKDPFLKERLFGLSGPQGNHGEDVKECYFYIDNTPTHSYMKALYKYPQEAFPYEKIIEENARRGYMDREYKLVDTGIFDHNRYFDVCIEYAKQSPNDILINIEIFNRGPEAAVCHLLPTFWFRNLWSWGYDQGPMGDYKGSFKDTPPLMSACPSPPGTVAIKAEHASGGTYYLYAEGEPTRLFTENETNAQLLYNAPNSAPYVKDAFHNYVVHGHKNSVNPQKMGTKSAMHYQASIASGQSAVFRLRLTNTPLNDIFDNFAQQVHMRQSEADDFYQSLQAPDLSQDLRNIQRQAFAGLLWNKQLYYYDIEQWLSGDSAQPQPPVNRQWGRNSKWEHLVNFDIISMPDKWEYPWYASWDLGFHCVALVLIDPDFAKRQLTLMTREWYMHPNGQLPAYEWNLRDVNPPVQAWAAWRVYKIDGKASGVHDRDFLKGIFHKLLLNFTWWINRHDAEGNNVFQGGFLGMDNISLFDRSSPLPTGGHITQSDGTAWIGFFCALMMNISLELSKEEPIYQDMATKFFEHFMRIATAMTKHGERAISLWDNTDGFFYDCLHLPNHESVRLKVRSLVGLLPLFAVETFDSETLNTAPVFNERMHWFISKKPHYTSTMSCVETEGVCSKHIMAIATREHLVSILRYMLDENEFLSPYGIRSLSKYHLDNPYTLHAGGKSYPINYQPGESQTGLFGGNSNWRGPIWFPINYLIIESLQKFHRYYGDTLKVEFPTRSGQWLNLEEVATELSKRLMGLFSQNGDTPRPIYGAKDSAEGRLGSKRFFHNDPHWKDLILFHEYFHGDSGEGLGAEHQTGWTALVAKLIQQSGCNKSDHPG